MEDLDMLDIGRSPSQIRKDPISGRWVIISKDRAKRPHDWLAETGNESGNHCPFCLGNENLTPSEIFAIRDGGTLPNSPGWKIRVVSNKFPALQMDDDLNFRDEGIFSMINGFGTHEVLIESPEHLIDLADLSIEHIRDIFWIFRERYIDLKRDDRFKYILVFKNHGNAAGASLRHPHSQIIALPIIPKRVMEELTGALEYYNERAHCIFCDLIQHEIQHSSRIVISHSKFIAFEPYAARFPFETWILPTEHFDRFEDITYDDCFELALIIKQTLQRLNDSLNKPPYNLIVHSSPLHDEKSLSYHWHIELIPKLANIAGFEWGAGFYINTIPPEEAACVLRNSKI